jgi:hypothetical protein
VTAALRSTDTAAVMNAIGLDGRLNLWLQTTCALYDFFGMSAGSDHDWRPYVRGAVVGLVVAASTFMSDLATYVGPLDSSRLTSFGLAGGFAAAVALLLAVDKKKVLL